MPDVELGTILTAIVTPFDARGRVSASRVAPFHRSWTARAAAVSAPA